MIQRKDRKRTLAVLADPNVFGTETGADLFNRLRPQIEALEIPNGYELEWGGEYESSNEAKAGLFASLPMGFLAMFLITVVLFNAIRAPLGDLGHRTNGHSRCDRRVTGNEQAFRLHGPAGPVEPVRHAAQERHRAAGPGQY